MKPLFQILLTVVILSACGNETQKAADASDVVMSLPAMEERGEAGAIADGSVMPESGRVEPFRNAKIIRNGSTSFQVKNAEESHKRIVGLLKKYEAYIGSDNQSTGGDQLHVNMVLRVPSAQFEPLLNDILKESIYTNYNNVTTEDVTSQFVDVEARLKTKKEVEQRYLAILREAKKIQDILDVEEKLRVLREEIESTEGQLKLMKDQVSYSTISLNMYQQLDYRPKPETGFFSQLYESFISGWRNVVSFFLAVVKVWPFLIIWIVLLYLAYQKFWKK